MELGSGTGQHVIAFARRAPGIVWWPSHCEEAHMQSIAAWRAQAQLGNVRQPLRIDASEPDWGLQRAGAPAEFMAILCINVLHIAPWRVADGLLAGAARHLRADGRLFVYDRSCATASIPRPATPRSIKACVDTIPNGACAILMISVALLKAGSSCSLKP